MRKRLRTEEAQSRTVSQMESRRVSCIGSRGFFTGEQLGGPDGHGPLQHPEEDLYNSHMEFTLYDENGHVIHIFERGNLSRATYKYMTRKIQDNFDSKLTPEENWANAEKAWDNLSPELQAQLFILSHSEEQNFEDIRRGLLATLADYQGFKCIKDLFEDAIKCVTLDD